MTYYSNKVPFLAHSRNTIMELIKKNKIEMRLNCDAENDQAQSLRRCKALLPIILSPREKLANSHFFLT
jgi:hypothetical protein